MKQRSDKGEKHNSSGKRISEITRAEENKVMKSVKEKGSYEMSEKKKKTLYDAWDKAKPGWRNSK